MYFLEFSTLFFDKLYVKLKNSIFYGGVQMHFGFTSTTLRQIKDVSKIVEIAKKTGAECIEWGGDIHVTDIEAAKKAKSLCDEAGIRICSYGSYSRVGSCDEAEWRKTCEIAGEMNAKTVRVWLGKADSEKTDDETYARLVADAKSMCAVAAEYGLNVCPECHGNTYNNNTDAFLKIRADVGCENFTTYFQSLYKRKEYDLDRIERTLPHIGCVHVSYFEQFREQFPKLKPHYMAELLKKLSDCGYDGDVLVEFVFFSYRYGMPSALKKELEKLRK